MGYSVQLLLDDEQCNILDIALRTFSSNAELRKDQMIADEIRLEMLKKLRQAGKNV